MCVSPQSAPLPYSKPFQNLAFFPLCFHLALCHLCYFFLYHLFYLYFILECPSLCSCHGKTECAKWWFIPAFPGPLQIVACLCFCFFFSSPFFFFLLIPFFPAWHKGMCASLSLRSSKFICLSLMAISHCHNTKLLTVVGECLFSHSGYSSSLFSVCLA